MKIAVISAIVFCMAFPAFGSNLSKQDINNAYFVQFMDGSQSEQIAWSPIVQNNRITYTICDEETDICMTVSNKIDDVVLYKINPKNFIDQEYVWLL